MTSECCVFNVICKTWTGLSARILTNSADPDQTSGNAASDQGLCLLKLQEVNITKTYLYNFDPLKPHFYIVKLGFTVVYIFFVFLLKTKIVGTR